MTGRAQRSQEEQSAEAGKRGRIAAGKGARPVGLTAHTLLGKFAEADVPVMSSAAKQNNAKD